MKLVLIGFMGSGKSSVAAKIAAKTGLTHIEMDDLILARSQCRSIPEIFKQYGEERFRELESEVSQSLQNSTNAVISTGGGVICSGDNLAWLRENGGLLVLLEAAFSTIGQRLTGSIDRPLFEDRQKALDLYNRRLQQYRSCADYTVATDALNVDQVAEIILQRIASGVTRENNGK